MTDALVTGQQHLWINELDMRIAGLILTFTMTIPMMRIVGDHRTSANMINGAITIPISGAGTVTMNCHNVVVEATGQLRTLAGTGTLNLDRLVTNVRMPSVDATLTGFGALDGTMSRMISSAAPGMVANSQERINEDLTTRLVPALNRFLNQHTMVTLVNLMADRNQNPPPRTCFG